MTRLLGLHLLHQVTLLFGKGWGLVGLVQNSNSSALNNLPYLTTEVTERYSTENTKGAFVVVYTQTAQCCDVHLANVERAVM